jgi:phage/plasmid-like protein (TIGR03299 family)
LNGGRQVWILAKLPGEIRVLGEDITNKYVLLTNSHDGSGTVQAKVTGIRVVCWNTLSAALTGRGASHSIRHTENVVDAVREAAETMGFVNKMYENLNEVFQRMSETKLSSKKSDEYILSVLKAAKQTQKATLLDDGRDNEEEDEKNPRAFAKIKELAETGLGTDIKGVRGTLWGTYNAITEYIDHKKYRSDDSRLDSVWFNGSGQRVKLAAQRQAITLLK